MNRLTDTVKTLLIANVMFYLGSQFLGDAAYKLFALWYPGNPNFEYWQLITHMFMHGGLTHILFNMFALYIFGSVLEMYVGQQRFLFLYFSAGLGAAGLQILFSYFGFKEAYQYYIDAGVTPSQIQDILESVIETGQYRDYGISNEISNQLISNYVTPMVGASGAIFGVLAAFAVIYPNMPLYIIFIPIPIKAKYLIGGYFALNVISAVTGSSLAGPSNTAYWAHIGGAVIGFFTMWVWKKNQFNQNRWN
ncbi:rhomboid family intramembrane serine protease [Mesohalobacter halotolerans]|uniref:Rhomboid family intramembrane serine protease n=1 Tax=Mesohalobacter halotolerans TaxID=1883405 RepID=A0A4U5TSG2_9FLAO|nr:rhomboid family intramembrane serine protease [Mesohalobacter halotolerans]MBS3739479.1 rhomboid family intramembrane serine protease [Psychroflexus sp.]TKS56364.1 rhomboid family intramembrane serine protease [Mesohalobacter halotolerans]